MVSTKKSEWSIWFGFFEKSHLKASKITWYELLVLCYIPELDLLLEKLNRNWEMGISDSRIFTPKMFLHNKEIK